MADVKIILFLSDLLDRHYIKIVSNLFVGATVHPRMYESCIWSLDSENVLYYQGYILVPHDWNTTTNMMFCVNLQCDGIWLLQSMYCLCIRVKPDVARSATFVHSCGWCTKQTYYMMGMAVNSWCNLYKDTCDVLPLSPWLYTCDVLPLSPLSISMVMLASIILDLVLY